jgi:hypothetical protein
MKIYLIHSVANLQEPYRENLHDPVRGQSKWATPRKYTCPSPWPIYIYMSRTVRMYMTRSVSNPHGSYCENLRGPYRENVHDPFRVQSTGAVSWECTLALP